MKKSQQEIPAATELDPSLLQRLQTSLSTLQRAHRILTALPADGMHQNTLEAACHEIKHFRKRYEMLLENKLIRERGRGAGKTVTLTKDGLAVREHFTNARIRSQALSAVKNDADKKKSKIVPERVKEHMDLILNVIRELESKMPILREKEHCDIREASKKDKASSQKNGNNRSTQKRNQQTQALRTKMMKSAAETVSSDLFQLQQNPRGVLMVRMQMVIEETTRKWRRSGAAEEKSDNSIDHSDTIEAWT